MSTTRTPPVPAANDTATLDGPPPMLHQLIGWYVGGMIFLTIDLGHRLGLFDAAAGAGPLTSNELADRAHCDERYVREWLGTMVTAGIFDFDRTASTYTVSDASASCLTSSGPFSLGDGTAMLTMIARYVEPIAGCFRSGGGLTYDHFRPDFTTMMDGLGRRRYDAALVEQYLPVAAGLVESLRTGITVADIGCGTGHTTNLMAAAFPHSQFLGIDLADDAIERGRAEATELGLDNVRFVVADILDMTPAEPFGLVCAFDCIHDQVDPAGVLSWVTLNLDEHGTFLMVDVAASSDVAANIANPIAPGMYATSLFHCLTVSLAHRGAGLGAMWGEELATAMLHDAGLADVTVHHLAVDPVNAVYVARRSAPTDASSSKP